MSNPLANQRQDEDTVREAVRERYGGIARRELAGSTRPAGGCGPAQAGEVVAVIDDAEAGCCAPDGTSEAQIEAVKAFYQASETSALPASVTGAALGCGNPTAIAELAPGETVLDLGSGGGIDCFLAAQRVGPGGRVIGVDMTEEMIALARGNAAKVGATNVEFRRGQIEALPVQDESVDVLISNCVINLSPDKPRVLREAYRALKPGGRFRVSDMVLTKELDVAEREYLSEWAGCVAGALRPDEFARHLAAAGFVDVRVAIGEGEHDSVRSADISARKLA